MTDSGPVIVELDCALVGVCRSCRWRSEAGRAVGQRRPGLSVRRNDKRRGRGAALERKSDRRSERESRTNGGGRRGPIVSWH